MYGTARLIALSFQGEIYAHLLMFIYDNKFWLSIYFYDKMFSYFDSFQILLL